VCYNLSLTPNKTGYRAGTIPTGYSIKLLKPFPQSFPVKIKVELDAEEVIITFKKELQFLNYLFQLSGFRSKLFDLKLTKKTQKKSVKT
jgi:hypothetical protein